MAELLGRTGAVKAATALTAGIAGICARGVVRVPRWWASASACSANIGIRRGNKMPPKSMI
jgi:hypothetical protein